MAGVRLADILGSLSLATDLAIGAPLETVARTCLVATHLARACGATAPRDVYYAAILRHVGCTAWAHEAAAIVGGDDHDVIQTFEGVDRGRRSAMVRRAMQLGRARSPAARVRAIAGALAAPTAGARLATAQCAQATALARDLGLGDGVGRALGQIYERFDGRGAPLGLRGDALDATGQLVVAAQLVEALVRRLGGDGAFAELRRRRGRELSPSLMDTVIREESALREVLEAPAFERLLDAEPAPVLVIDPDQLDAIALAFARFADLKTPLSIGHSPAVAALAVKAGTLAGVVDTATLHRAALLHDLGTVTVANGVWEQPGPLPTAAWEQVRLHAYHTERVLARSAALAPYAAIAGAHHERLDGSGYHRGARAESLSVSARILAAADAHVAMHSPRPQRPPLADPARALEAEARAGRLCRDAVAAVLVAAGHARVRPALPAALTEREAEVLAHVARGLSSKEIASALGITTRTVKHHIEHIYEKTGVSTRAAAALFAARHDLV